MIKITKFFKIKEISPQTAIIISALIISLSIFLTGWLFLGSHQSNKIKTPTPPPQRTLTPEQIKKIQEDRAAQIQKKNPAPIIPATTSTENEE